ncbi:hypothetical protein N7448_002037 [Penicillium atrosanguineum]|nr:hypothetical protein N7448_002037 [Penicillium atrosanguineum]
MQRASVISAEREPTQNKDIDDKVCKPYFVPDTFPRMVRRVSSFPPQRPYQVHYGASSNISLLNHLYQSFNPLFGGDFLIRRLHNFSESLGESSTKMIDPAAISEFCQKTIFLADEVAPALAEEILEHFLAVHRLLIPVQKPQAIKCDLHSLYDIESIPALSNARRRALLLMLATASLTTRHHKLADIFIHYFNELSSSADDNLTTSSIEIDCLLIQHAFYYTEKGLSNDAYLSIGSATRKIFSAGLHRDPPQGSRSDLEIEEQRNLNFNNRNSWICVHLGRPSSFTAVQLAVPPPKDPFLLALVGLSEIMTKCSNQIYIPNKGSLLPIWMSAVALISDLHKYEDMIIDTFGFGLHHRSQIGELDVPQTILTTLYLHTFILIFRPFVIFGGKLKTQKPCSDSSEHGSRSNPPWLDTACGYALDATKKLIDYLFLAISSNQTVKDMRYNHVFLENCCAVLSYDILHDRDKVPAHVPSINKSLACLSQMRPGEQVQRIITSFQTLLAGIESANALNHTDWTSEISIAKLDGSSADYTPSSIYDSSTWSPPKESIEVLNDPAHFILS